MFHISSAVTPSSAVIIASGSPLRWHARSKRAPMLPGMRASRPVRMFSRVLRWVISLAVDSAPALTATRHELAASISAFTHWAITD